MVPFQSRNMMNKNEKIHRMLKKYNLNIMSNAFMYFIAETSTEVSMSFSSSSSHLTWFVQSIWSHFIYEHPLMDQIILYVEVVVQSNVTSCVWTELEF